MNRDVLIEEIRGKWPAIYETLNSPLFTRQAHEAESLISEGAHRQNYERIRASTLTAKRLFQNVYTELFDSFFSTIVNELDRDLRILRERFGSRILKGAFADKLLDDRFDNTATEIAAAIVMSDVLDSDSIRFEEPLPGSRKNPDMTGCWGGDTVIAEVTTVNIEFPPRTEAELENIIVQVAFHAGFNLWLSAPIISTERADRIRRTLERLFAERLTLSDQVDVDGVIYRRERDDSYRSQSSGSLIQHVQFHSDMPESRTVQEGIFSSSTVSPHDRQYLADRYPAVSGVQAIYFGSPGDDASHRGNPISMAIRSMITGKLSQCLEGEINIIILGVPSPFLDLEVENALYGTQHVTCEYVNHGPDSFGLDVPSLRRVPGGIFRLLSASAAELSDEEQSAAEDYVGLYRDISGVLLLRTGVYSRAEFYPNQNASRPLSAERQRTLLEAARRRSCRT